MRNIWFRGLGKNDIWRYGHYFVVNDVLQSYHYIRENSSDHRINPTTLGQFTGLKDRNGKEIYELSEINGRYRVEFRYNRYILQHISNSDIYIEFSPYDEYEITREYSPIQKD